MNALEERRARHMATVNAMAPELIARLDWDAGRLAAHRTQALRELLRVAVDRSPWHRKRLAGLCPESVQVGDLAHLPAMTKAEVMDNFDDLMTDRHLRLVDVEDHLLHAADRGYLLGEYTAAATGGSTGRRGVTVYDWTGWATYCVSVFRWLLQDRARDPALAGRPLTAAYVIASHPSHVGSAVGRTFRDPALINVILPCQLPVAQIVAGLNECRPDVLIGYPSMLNVLAGEAITGRLRIAPLRVMSSGEALLPEIRAALSQAWPVPIVNAWASTETGGLVARCDAGRSHLADDLSIIEPVDAAGAPVPAGQRSAKVYVTSLFNHLQPLIRYELTDEVTLLADPCPCGRPSACVEDVQGRQDDWFVYGDRLVQPPVFRSALGHRPEIVEYQVRQTVRGADITVSCRDRVDLTELTTEIVTALADLDLPDPELSITVVDRLDRLPHTGKLKRFVPLAPR